ncbi:MAG: HAD hydrolase-like protein, partial [Acidobacteria bacterium]|nr:HAD hydrolase-like protein [Acidobacteriota bacterium]
KKTFELKNIFMIGDSVKDILAARRNGIKVVSVATGLTSYENLRKENPDYLLENFESESFLDELQ